MRARSSMMPLVVAASLVLASTATTRAASSPVQLLEVRPQQEAGRLAVLLEASAPVAYTSRQPDPFTVVVDLRHTSASTTVNRFRAPGPPPVAGVTVQQATAADGTPVARVRLELGEPFMARVRSHHNAVLVEFPDVVPAAAPVAASATAVSAAATGEATELVSVTSELREGVARVRLRGNGVIRPRTVEEARDLPPRILVDLPGVRPRVPAVQAVGSQPLSRIRVATNSEAPLVTRVVLDLTKRTPYRTTSEGRDFVIELGEVAPPAPATASLPASGEPATAVPPAVAEPVARTAIATEPDVVPDRDVPAPAPKPAPAPSEAPAASRAARSTPASRATPPAPAAGVPAASSAAPQAPSLPAQQTTPPTAALAAAGPGDAARQFTGHPVSLDFQGVDLRAVLRTFAEITGLNLVIDQQVEGKVDVALRDVPWDQALDIILRANKLGYSVEGTIVRIAPLSVLAAEEALKRKLAEEKAMAGELVVMTRTLNYAGAKEVEPLLKGVLSSRGKSAVDLRTNTLILYDLPEYLPRVTTLLDTLDQPELQVEIEARIIQTQKAFARELGMRWGFSGSLAPELGNTLPVAFPNSGDIEGAAGPLVPGRVRGRDVAGISMRAINGSFNINAELSALERTGQIKTLLTPRIVTQNNVKATITRGQEIPYTTTTAAPPPGGAAVIAPVPTVQFRTAALTLSVTPRITAANTVILDVDVDNGSPGDTQENGNRAINTQRAQTKVLVADGATTVIGGIQGNTTEDNERRTPGLWRLPILGHLFRDTSRESVDEEILIFITPRIIRMPATPAPAAQTAPSAQ